MTAVYPHNHHENCYAFWVGVKERWAKEGASEEEISRKPETTAFCLASSADCVIRLDLKVDFPAVAQYFVFVPIYTFSSAYIEYGQLFDKRVLHCMFATRVHVCANALEELQKGNDLALRDVSTKHQADDVIA